MRTTFSFTKLPYSLGSVKNYWRSLYAGNDMPDNLETRIIELIAIAQKISPESVRLDSSLEELGIDSYEGINLLFVLEDEFDIDISVEAIKMFTVADIVEGVRALKAEVVPEAEEVVEEKIV